MRDHWTDDLLSDAREVVLDLLAEPSALTPDLGALAERVWAFREQIHLQARPMTDLPLADDITAATLELLRLAARGSAETKRLASVAARYLVDGDPELASPYGFDDDVEVFNAIASRIAPTLILNP